MVRAFLLLLLIPLKAWAIECSLQGHKDVGREVLAELSKNPINCNKQPVHLTFDDGPTNAVTPELLDELKSRRVKASFFVTTTNLVPGHRNYSQNVSIVRRTLNEGHLIANHGHDHVAYDVRMNAEGRVLEEGLSQREREEQLNRSVSLLNAATNNRFSSQGITLFRFPYGRGAIPSARELDYMNSTGKVVLRSQDYAGRLKEYREQSAALQTIAGSGHSHLGWNHDSGDSSFGATNLKGAQLKTYIISNLKNMCNSRIPVVSLFHDIKPFNKTAVPVIIDIGRCLGLNFISAQEMMSHKEILNRTGVLISKREVDRGQFESLDALIESLNLKTSGKVDCSPEAEKSCFSQQLGRRFNECEGGESICYDGKWYSSRDPMVILNCGR